MPTSYNGLQTSNIAECTFRCLRYFSTPGLESALHRSIARGSGAQSSSFIISVLISLGSPASDDAAIVPLTISSLKRCCDAGKDSDEEAV